MVSGSCLITVRCSHDFLSLNRAGRNVIQPKGSLARQPVTEQIVILSLRSSRTILDRKGFRWSSYNLSCIWVSPSDSLRFYCKADWLLFFFRQPVGSFLRVYVLASNLESFIIRLCPPCQEANWSSRLTSIPEHLSHEIRIATMTPCEVHG
jgi:hypothetical protein